MKNQNTSPSQKNKEILSTILTIGFIVLAVVVIVGGSYFSDTFTDIVNSFKSYDSYIEKGSHINEEKDVAVLIYPEHIFRDEEELNESVKTLKAAEGTKKVIKNDDGSVTSVMSVERYEEIREAAQYAALSLPYMMINEESAIRDMKYNEEYTLIEVTANREKETLQNEMEDIIYLVSFFHICNMDEDARFTINYIDNNTGEVYLTESYNTKREKAKE